MHRFRSFAVAVIATAALGTGLMAGSNGTTTTSVQEGSTFQVDPTHSSVIFGIKHLDIANFYGRFDVVGGTFDLEGGKLDVTIDVQSVDTNSDGRDKHLRSADFFNVAQFPSATFTATELIGEGDEYDVAGDLTIRGETKRITFKLIKTGEGDRGERFGYRCGFEAIFEFNRSDFGITYMPGGLSEQVKMIVSLEGVRQ